MRHKVYVTEPIHTEAAARLTGALPTEFGDISLPREEIKRRLADATIILSKTDPLLINREIIDAAPNLIHIARHGSGYSNVDVDYASSKGVSVSYLSGLNVVSMAEYTIALLLLAARKLVPAIEQSRKGNPPRSQFLGIELSGKTIGIVGVGQIGREVVKRASVLGMTVLGYHPRPQGKDFSGLDMILVEFDELLAKSDFVSIHTPLSAETRNLVGARELGLMKPGAYLLNLGRGGIIDEVALANALCNDRIGGAVLDVLAQEPVRADEPLLAFENCIILPHIAAMTAETQARTAMAAVENILAVSRGERPQYLANPQAWPPAHA